MKNVFRVTLTSKNGQTGQPNFVNFECGYASLELLVAELNDGVMVIGELLRTKKTKEAHVYEVVTRQPYALMKAGVAAIEVPYSRFVEYEPETGEGGS